MSTASYPSSPVPAEHLETDGQRTERRRLGFKNNQEAGQFTDNLPLSEALYLPIGTPAGTLGVIGVRLFQPNPPNLEQRNLLEAFVRQAGLVIDRQRLHDAAQQSRLAAESERLSKTLLDSISHEMRTPIAAISSAASALSDAG